MFTIMMVLFFSFFFGYINTELKTLENKIYIVGKKDFQQFNQYARALFPPTLLSCCLGTSTTVSTEAVDARTFGKPAGIALSDKSSDGTSARSDLCFLLVQVGQLYSSLRLSMERPCASLMPTQSPCNHSWQPSQQIMNLGDVDTRKINDSQEGLTIVKDAYVATSDEYLLLCF